jgi:hypothetical protein
MYRQHGSLNRRSDAEILALARGFLAECWRAVPDASDKQFLVHLLHPLPVERVPVDAVLKGWKKLSTHGGR